MPSEIPLDQIATVVLDGSGYGVVTLGPAKFNESWLIEGLSVNVSTNTNEPKASIYRDQVSQTTLINGTYSGSFDTDPAFNYELQSGRKVAVEWEGGDAGAVATVRLWGKDRFR